jgi:hypothetical protein
MITWIGARARDAFGAVGAESLVERSCSQTNSIYGVGLITCAAVGLLALGLFLFLGAVKDDLPTEPKTNAACFGSQPAVPTSSRPDGGFAGTAHEQSPPVFPQVAWGIHALFALWRGGKGGGLSTNP